MASFNKAIILGGDSQVNQSHRASGSEYLSPILFKDKETELVRELQCWFSKVWHSEIISPFVGKSSFLLVFKMSSRNECANYMDNILLLMASSVPQPIIFHGLYNTNEEQTGNRELQTPLNFDYNRWMCCGVYFINCESQNSFSGPVTLATPREILFPSGEECITSQFVLLYFAVARFGLSMTRMKAAFHIRSPMSPIHFSSLVKISDEK